MVTGWLESSFECSQSSEARLRHDAQGNHRTCQAATKKDTDKQSVIPRAVCIPRCQGARPDNPAVTSSMSSGVAYCAQRRWTFGSSQSCAKVCLVSNRTPVTARTECANHGANLDRPATAGIKPQQTQIDGPDSTTRRCLGRGKAHSIREGDQWTIMLLKLRGRGGKLVCIVEDCCSAHNIKIFCGAREWLVPQVLKRVQPIKHSRKALHLRNFHCSIVNLT